MAFLATVGNKCALKLQKSFLNFQALQNANQKKSIMAEMASIKKAYAAQGDDQVNYEDTEEYQALELEDERLDTESETIAQQVAVIDEIIKNADNMIKNGIKSSCGLTLAGGS